MAEMEVTHDRNRSCECMTGWHRPECERGDERWTDLSKDRIISGGNRDGIDRVWANEPAGFVNLTSKIFPPDRGFNRRADVAARHPGDEQGIAKLGE
jgi:hypothetical protein